MNNWIEIKFDDKEYEDVWNRFYDRFDFTPSVKEDGWPSFKEPNPFITFDISHIYDNPEFEQLNKDLEDKILLALRNCTQPEEYICFRLAPSLLLV